MAQPFIIVDLSPRARDFQPIALEPGRPMLDRLKSNYQVLRAWLREFVAEPEPAGDGDAVGFLIPARVRGEAGQAAERPLVDACVPATAKDIGGPLRKELDELRRLIQQATPKTATERALHRVLLRARDTQLDPAVEQPGCNLFKYRDDAGKWRLVWCWGYQRRDDGPGEPVVHDGQLYFRRPGERLADLVGSAAIADDDAARPKRRRRVPGVLMGLALLALGGASGWLLAQPKNQKILWRMLGGTTAPPALIPGPLTPQDAAPTPKPSDSESPAAKSFALKITPEGPETVPVGQKVRLLAWKDYGEGRREQLTDDLEWKADDVPGLTFHDGEVTATKPNAGPLKVKVTSGGQESNEVEIRSGAPTPVALTINVDRPVLLVGEAGQLVLSATDERGGPVDLGSEGKEFKLSEGADPNLLDLKPDGTYRAKGPGTVTVTASHPATEQPATRAIRIVDSSTTRLVFQPQQVTVAVGAVAELKLLLEGGGEPIPLGDHTPVDIKNDHSEEIHWESPDLLGIKPVEPFDLVATYQIRGNPDQTLSATARVAVVAADKATALRIRSSEATTETPEAPPSEATLAPDLPISLIVEQKLGDAWQVVRPDLVDWGQIPESVIWSPADGGFPPMASLREGAAEVTLTAAYPAKGNRATFTLKPMPEEEVANLRKEAERLRDDPKVPRILVPEREVTTGRAGQPRRTRYRQGVELDGRRVTLPGGPVITYYGPGYPWWLPYEYEGRTYRGWVGPPERRVVTPAPRPGRIPTAPRPLVSSTTPETIPDRQEKVAILEEPHEYQDKGTYSVDVKIDVPSPDWKLEYRVAARPGDQWKRAAGGKLVLESQEFPAAVDHGDVEIEVRDPSKPTARLQSFKKTFSLVRPKPRVMSTSGE